MGISLLGVFALLSLSNASGQTFDQWIVDHFGRAQRAQQENNLDAAAKEYRLVISHDPKFAGAYLNLGIVYHQQRRYSDAVKVLRTAVLLDPRALGGQLFLGIDEYLSGDFRNALSHLKIALQLKPANREAGVYLGLTYLALNQPLRAAGVLRTTAEYYPTDSAISYQIGQAYLEGMKEASAELKQFGNQTAPYHWGLAIGAEGKNDRVMAIQEYMRALACDPTIAELYLRLAIVSEKSGFPYLASAALHRFKVLNPTSNLVESDLANLGPESHEKGAFASDNKVAFQRLWDAIPPLDGTYSGPLVADRFVNRALMDRLASPAGPILKAALELYSSGHYKEAAAKISALKFSFTDWATAYLLALAHMHASDYDEAAHVVEDRLLPYLKVPSVSLLAIEIESWFALRYLNRVIAMQPNSYFAKLLQADYYAATEQSKEALATYQEALTLAPNHLGIHLAIGKVYEHQLQWVAAVEEFKAELALAPANAMALAHLCHALTEARQAREAIAALEKLLKSNPHDGEAYADLGKAYELEGETGKAIRAYSQALLNGSSYIGAHYRLFQLYRKTGEQDKAQKELAAFKAAEAQQQESYLQSLADLK
jgi:tetratricopeptide (TPR) repeat protein